jgi:hypothetical protein
VAVVDVDAEMGYTLPPRAAAESNGLLRAKLELVMVREISECWSTAFHNVDIKPLRSVLKTGGSRPSTPP